MLNESHVEGVIASKWSYNEVQFVRVAVYPDAGRTARRADPQGRDTPDYVTLRCEGSHALAATSLREGDRVRVSGILDEPGVRHLPGRFCPQGPRRREGRGGAARSGRSSRPGRRACRTSSTRSSSSA